MNTLSSLLDFIADKLVAINNRTRNVLTKGTYTEKTLYGVYGFVGASNYAYITVPVNIASDVSSISISSLKCSLRTVKNGYLGGTSGNVDLTSYIIGQAVSSDQPFFRITVQDSNFGSEVQHTPFSGNITMTFVLS